MQSSSKEQQIKRLAHILPILLDKGWIYKFKGFDFESPDGEIYDLSAADINKLDEIMEKRTFDDWKDDFYKMYLQEERYPEGYKPPVAILDSSLPDTHYTNPYYNKARLMYGTQQKTDDGAYSDRLSEWDFKKSDKAHDHASKKTSRNTPRWWQEYLSYYYGKPVEIIYILGDYNLSSGFPYYYLGWNYKDK